MGRLTREEMLRLANIARPVRGGGMISPAKGGPSVFNAHNQGVLRAEYQGPRGSGFAVEFLEDKARIKLDEGLAAGFAVITGSSIEALVTANDELKQKMRTYLDGHFRGSAMHGNAHRRISNAAVQSAYFDSVKEGVGFASTIYSKFGFGKGPKDFVDFLLLHMRGGTIRPANGGWLRVPGRARFGGGKYAGARWNLGSYEQSSSKIFFVKSKDGQKMYLLRQQKGGVAAELLETLVKSLTIKPSLQGLEGIMATNGAVFERHFAASFTRRKAEAGL